VHIGPRHQKSNRDRLSGFRRRFQFVRSIPLSHTLTHTHIHTKVPFHILVHRRRGLQWTEDNGRFVRATRVLSVLAHAASASSNGSVLLLLLLLLLLYYYIIILFSLLYAYTDVVVAECLIDVRGQRWMPARSHLRIFFFS